MKLEKYADKRKKRRKILLISIGVIVLVSISFLLYKTFARYSEEVSFLMMNGKVDYYGNSDVYFAFYKSDEMLDTMPEKDNSEGLVYIDVECDNRVNHNIIEVSEGIDLPTDERYYDKYDYSTSNTTYNRGKLGDATKEFGPFQSMKYLTQSRNVGSWYNDEAWLVNSGIPWLIRGSAFSGGTGAGIFTYQVAYGTPDHSFRLVLVI